MGLFCSARMDARFPIPERTAKIRCITNTPAKLPYLWHMNNPVAKVRLKEMSAAYPNHFLTPEGTVAMASTPDEHPGHRPQHH